MLTVVFYYYYIIPALLELFSGTLFQPQIILTTTSCLCCLNISISWWNVGPSGFFLQWSIRLYLQTSLISSLFTLLYLKGSKFHFNYSQVEWTRGRSSAKEALHSLWKRMERRCLHQQSTQPLVRQCNMPTAVLLWSTAACILEMKNKEPVPGVFTRNLSH